MEAFVPSVIPNTCSIPSKVMRCTLQYSKAFNVHHINGFDQHFMFMRKTGIVCKWHITPFSKFCPFALQTTVAISYRGGGWEAVLRIRIRIRIRMFSGLTDPLVTSTDPAPDPSIIKQK